MIKCKNCGSENPGYYIICEECASEFAPNKEEITQLISEAERARDNFDYETCLRIYKFLAELGVCGYTLYHIFTHKSYKRGSRALWVALTIIFMNSFIGPILYFLLGREGT